MAFPSGSKKKFAIKSIRNVMLRSQSLEKCLKKFSLFLSVLLCVCILHFVLLCHVGRIGIYVKKMFSVFVFLISFDLKSMLFMHFVRDKFPMEIIRVLVASVNKCYI